MYIKNDGFTLIELLITIAIIGILSAIALPVYENYVEKTRRVQACTTLMDLSSKLEIYYNEHHSYKDALNAKDYKNEFYNFKITSGENSYLIKAIPLKGQKKDKICEVLTLDETGTRSIEGSGKLKNCWP